jgi:hypothetical protein
MLATAVSSRAASISIEFRHIFMNVLIVMFIHFRLEPLHVVCDSGVDRRKIKAATDTKGDKTKNGRNFVDSFEERFCVIFVFARVFQLVLHRTARISEAENFKNFILMEIFHC